jgi:cephalosporin hydroxylase
MVRRIAMIEDSSIAPEVVSRVKQKAAGKRSVLVLLDSNHTHGHVLAECRDALEPFFDHAHGASEW